MKKGKVFSKAQFAVGVMLLAVAVAVWLNAKYLPSATKYLGETSYVSNTLEDETSSAVQTSTDTVVNENYFERAVKERTESRQAAVTQVEELLDNKNLTDEDKQAAVALIEKIGKNIETEANIETLLKAKGFEEAIAVLSDESISIIVKSEGLTSAQTLQIQDVVTEQTEIPLSKIKIIPVVK